VDSALKTTYMVILRKPGGITFSVVSHGASSTALNSGGSRGGSGAHAGAGAGASSGGSGVATGTVCVSSWWCIAPSCTKDTIIVYGPRISVGDYVLTVHSHRAAGAADRKVPASILLKGDDQGANASYPLHLLLLPHEAAFTAGAGSVPATPGGVRRWNVFKGHMSDSTPVSLKHTINMYGCFVCGLVSCRYVQLPPLERAALLQPGPCPSGLAPAAVTPGRAKGADASAPATVAKAAAPPGVHTRGRDSAATASLGRQPRALTRGCCQVSVRAPGGQ
jgi:hypothetical protein